MFNRRFPISQQITTLISFLGLGLLPALADTQIIPQIADGSGWSTTIVLANKTASAQSVTLSFNQDTVNGATSPWTPPFVEGISQSSVSLAAGSTLFLHTSGTSSTLTQGWGQIDAAAGVVGYAIFTSGVGSSAPQDATAPAVSAATRILIPFDNSSGFVSAVAVANPTNNAETVQASIRTTDGTLTGTVANLPAKGQTTFLMANLFAGTAGKSGLAEIYVSSGTISAIALRANPSGSFTSAPVYFQTGSPIIGAPITPQTPSPQTQVIPQVADGAGWATAIVITNTTTGALPVTLNFHQAIPNGGGATTSWNPPFVDSSPLTFTLPAGASRFLRTPGTASALSQGWAELVADPRIVGYAIFTAAGARAQDSTAPAVFASSRILVPFDNSSGLVTAIALVDPTASAETVSVNFRTSDGTTTSTTAPALPAQGQITFLMPTQFPDTAGKSGLAEFYVSSGTISIIALRANPSGAITSAPVYFETGAPIVTTGGGGSTGGGGGGSTGGGGNQGGGLSTIPTQAEVDAWIARGTYASGSISMTRGTIYFTTDTIGLNGVTQVTTTTKTDAIGAQFTRFGGPDLGKVLRGELPPGFPNLSPTVGSCVVYDISKITDPYPSPGYTTIGIDAGPQITVNGPNGTQNLPRRSTQSIGFSYNVTNTTAPLNAYLAPGAYTVAGPGGADVGAFTGNGLTIVNDLVVTNSPDEFESVNRANGFTIRWTGGEPSTILTISGGSTTVSSTGTASGMAFVCIQNASAGNFTVPASILTQLPASSNGIIPGFFTRGTFSLTAAGKGVRYDTPSGLDILTGNNYWSWTFSALYK